MKPTEPIIQQVYVTVMLDKDQQPPADCIEYPTYDVQHARREHARITGKWATTCYMEHEGNRVYIPK